MIERYKNVLRASFRIKITPQIKRMKLKEYVELKDLGPVLRIIKKAIGPDFDNPVLQEGEGTILGASITVKGDYLLIRGITDEEG